MVEQKKRLFLGNLPDGINEKDIRKRFDRFGQVASVEIKVKKINDGKESSTFAFVELSTSPHQLDECINSTNGSEIKGLSMRVQVAKESFLSRLKAEREQQANKGKPAPPVQQPTNWGKSEQETSWKKPAALPVQQTSDASYDPLAMLRNFQKSKPSQDITPAVASKRSIADVEPAVKRNKFVNNKKKVFDEEEESAEGSSLMSKLENYSTMWTDLDSAPVQVETRENKVKEEESEDDEEEEVPTFKKPKLTVAEKIPELKPVVNEEEAKRKELDNQKRLQSLQQRNEALKSQHSLIKSALSLVDGPGQKKNKIIFDTEEPVEEEKPLKKRDKKAKKKPQLFDAEEEETFDIEDDFKMRPHLDGSTGQELLELQSRFGNDQRFKMDHRFAEKAEGNEEEEMDISAGDDERARQMSILGSLVPSLKAGPVDPTKSRITSKAFIRFDPNVKEHHDQFEKPKEKIVHHKVGHQLATAVAAAVVEPLPEVSSERYYQTSSLDIGSNANSGFSLRTLFQSSSVDDQVDDEKGEKHEPVVTKQKLFKSVITEGVQEPPTGYWKNAGMWHEPLFLQADDARFKEAIDFIHRKASQESYRDRSKWPEQRDRLLCFSRNKLRHHLQANNNNSSNNPASTAPGGNNNNKSGKHQRQQAAAVVDGDESSYHFFHGQPDSMSAAIDNKKKKPHRPYYKK